MRVPEGISIGPLDIGAVYEIDATNRLEVLDEIDKHLYPQVGPQLPDGVEVRLGDIESLVNIVMGETPAITTDSI